MEIDPESTVEFENGEGPIGRTGHLSYRSSRPYEGKGQKRQDNSGGSRAHVESHDSSANSAAVQTAGSFFPLFRNTRWNVHVSFSGRGKQLATKLLAPGRLTTVQCTQLRNDHSCYRLLGRLSSKSWERVLYRKGAAVTAGSLPSRIYCRFIQPAIEKGQLPITNLL